MDQHSRLSGLRPSLRRVLRAQWRDFTVLFHESRGPLLLFVLLIMGGALIFFFYYTDPHTGQRLTFSEALYGAFGLLFFQGSLDYPTQWYLQILYFVIPILGLVVVVDGVIRFGAALTNKQERGQKWQVAMASTYRDHVIICGLGKVGYRVMLELLKFERGVVVVDIDPNGRFIERAQALNIPIIVADARRSENLVKAGVEFADAILPCTDNELTNLDIALDARELNPDIKVVMRMFDPELAQRVEKGFGIHTTFSDSALAAPVFAAAAMRHKIRSSFYLNNQLLNISEVTVNPGTRLVGWDIARLEDELDLTVVGYEENSKIHLHPGPEVRLSAGSNLLVLASLGTLNRLEAMNKAS